MCIRDRRNTARQDGTSPAQLFFGRRQRLGLPVLPEALDQSPADPSPRDFLHENRNKNRDKSTACYSDFAVGDKVWMQHHATKKWYKTAIIAEIRHGGRAYLVKDQDGQLYVRGRRFLRIDDRNLSSNQVIRAVHFSTLSPFSDADTSIPAVSSHSLRPQSTSACAQDSFIKASNQSINCLLYTSPSPRDRTRSRMPSSA